MVHRAIDGEGGSDKYRSHSDTGVMAATVLFMAAAVVVTAGSTNHRVAVDMSRVTHAMNPRFLGSGVTRTRVVQYRCNNAVRFLSKYP